MKAAHVCILKVNLGPGFSTSLRGGIKVGGFITHLAVVARPDERAFAGFGRYSVSIADTCDLTDLATHSGGISRHAKLTPSDLNQLLRQSSKQGLTFFSHRNTTETRNYSPSSLQTAVPLADFHFPPTVVFVFFPNWSRNRRRENH